MRKLLYMFFIFALLYARADSNVRFIVVGDRTGGCVGGVFSEIIDEVALLDPDFVMCVGDLIHGYTADTLALHAQWDTIVTIIEKLSCQFYYVAGNHDIYNLIDRTIYEQRTGFKRYYSFDYYNNHFIVLDNTMTYWSPPQEMGEEQMTWLVKDLKKNTKRDNIFVFYHLPSYLYALQSNTSDPLMEIFEKYGVDVVFTGHHHTYSYLNRNGVEYINVGSSGGGMGDQDFGRGHFYQYLHVSVRGKENSIAVIQKDNVFLRNVITADDLLIVQRADDEAVQVDQLNIREGVSDLTQRINVTVYNFGPDSIIGLIPWEYDPTRYSILPAEFDLRVASDEQGEYSCNVTIKDGSDVFPIPRFKFRFPYSCGQSCTVTGYLPIKRIKPVKQVMIAPVFDGMLNEKTWEEIKPINKLADGMGYANTVVEETEIYICHDTNNLYLGVRCYESSFSEMSARATEHDGATPWDDNMWLFFDPDNSQENYYQMIVSSNATIFDRKCEMVNGESVKDLSWDGTWEAKSAREDNAWTLEIKVPKRGFLTYNELQWGFNFRRLQTRVGDAAYWTLPFGHLPEYFGLLEFE